IPDFAADAAHQFHFGVRGTLEMHAAYCSGLLRQCVIDLDYGLAPARNGKFLRAEDAREKAPCITQSLALNELQTGQWQVVHGKAVHTRAFRNRVAIGDASITLGDRTYAVVGVMPPNFERNPVPTDVWLPFASEGAMRDAAFGWITIRAISGASGAMI